jgi:hypothetical protein
LLACVAQDVERELVGELGTNISADGGIPAEDLGDLGVACVRLVARHDVNNFEYFNALGARGIRIWLVLARESFNGFGPMRADGQPAPETLAAAMSEYAHRYQGQIATYEVGNEPDIDSGSSWTMSQADFERLLFRARDRFGSDQNLVAGGLASGNPDWLGDLDAPGRRGLDWVNGIAIHPYGRTPDDRFPFEPASYFGRVNDLLADYRSWLDTNGRTDKQLHVSEWGAPLSDFSSEVPAPGRGSAGDFMRSIRDAPALADAARTTDVLGAQATYVRNMAATLRDSSMVGDAIQFCYSDGMVAGFGLTDGALQPLPAWDAMRPPVVA